MTLPIASRKWGDLPGKLAQVDQRPLRGVLGRLRGAVALVPELGADVLAVDEDVGAPGRAAAWERKMSDLSDGTTIRRRG